eukprot:UN01891
MCLQVTGFPENWNKQKIKNYVTKQTGLEVLNIGQQGLKTCFSFRRVTTCKFFKKVLFGVVLSMMLSLLCTKTIST